MQQIQQTEQTRQSRQDEETLGDLGPQDPVFVKITQPMPRNPCKGGPRLTAQRQPDHTDPADWSTQNPARKSLDWVGSNPLDE